MARSDGITINTENFLSALRTSFIGRRIYLYQTVESTQTIALSLAEQEKDNLDGTVIVSEHQTKGRGRTGRSWISPRGGIWLSIILKPKIKNSSPMMNSEMMVVLLESELTSTVLVNVLLIL